MKTAQPNHIKWAWLILLLIIVVAIIAGCSTAEKLLDKAERKDPAIVAKYARDKYPCTDLLKHDTSIVYKDSLVLVEIECPEVMPDSVILIKTDTVKNTIIKTIRVPVNIPVQIKYITKWYEDSAKQKICNEALNKADLSIQKLQAANDKLTTKVAHRGKENWIWRIIAICLICWQGWKIYRKLMIKI
jgi:hypothetical protein